MTKAKAVKRGKKSAPKKKSAKAKPAVKRPAKAKGGAKGARSAPAKARVGKSAAGGTPLERIFGGSPVIEKEGAKIRVLVGKAGLDGHDRGAKVIARAFRDAGFEVVYTGLHQTAEMIVNTAIQEDVDVLGISILSGAHNYLIPEIIKKLADQGVQVGEDILVVVGGIIPDTDFYSLKKAGVSMVFTPGTSVDSIIEFIR